MSKSSEMRKAKAVELAARYTPAGGTVLEVSCGAGNELLSLQQGGYRVTGTNYTRYEEESAALDIRHGVDLLQGLPFGDASFDTVMLLDVIEHLANHDRAIAELGRVCKPGGHVVIMTPNIMKLTSRVEFLLTGFFKLKRAFIGFDVPHESAFAFHNHPVHLPVFLYQMHARGLSLTEFAPAVYKKKSFVFYVLLWPFVALATWLKVGFGEKNLKGTAYAAQLQQCLTSVAGLCGEFLFLVSCKRGIPAALAPEEATDLPTWSRKWENDGGANRAIPAAVGAARR